MNERGTLLAIWDGQMAVLEWEGVCLQGLWNGEGGISLWILRFGRGHVIRNLGMGYVFWNAGIGESCVTKDHRIVSNCRRIPHKTSSYKSLFILEAWQINKTNNAINRDDGLKLPREYLSVVLKDKRHSNVN